jgi:integrase
MWVKVDDETMKTLKGLANILPRPRLKMTAQNKARLRQFDDKTVARLLSLPRLLWTEVEREPHCTRWTFAKAQAALAIAILTYMPIRLENLSSLQFGKQLHLNTGPNAVSTLELHEDEVKNRVELVFDIPTDLAQMLLEYRDRMAPKYIGRRPQHLFVNRDGRPKAAATVRYLIESHLTRRLGVTLNPHAFRHLAGKLILDREPGSYELVKQLLGHRSIETTVAFYTGVDTQRAANHHRQLIDERLETQAQSPAPRKRGGNHAKAA